MSANAGLARRLTTEIIVAGVLCGTVSLGWRHPLALALLCGAVVVVRLAAEGRAARAYAGAAAAVGGLCELVGVAAGAWQYSGRPNFPPLWTFLVWSLVGIGPLRLAVDRSAPTAHHSAADDALVLAWRRAGVAGAVSLAVALVLVSSSAASWAVLAVLVAGACVARLVAARRRVLVLFAVVGFSGGVAEAIAVTFGSWSYRDAVLAGLAPWTPAMWGIVGVVVAGLVPPSESDERWASAKTDSGLRRSLSARHSLTFELRRRPLPSREVSPAGADGCRAGRADISAVENRR